MGLTGMDGERPDSPSLTPVAETLAVSPMLQRSLGEG
jgi:hypothetical protein